MNKHHRRSILSAVSFNLLALAACVTVNVNFPEGAVQKAADDYVKELYKAKEKGTLDNGKGTTAPKSGFLETIIPSAHAQEASFKTNSEKAKAIQQKQAARLDEVLSLKKQGALGETSGGYLTLKDNGKLKPLLKKKAEKVVTDENADRKALYQEIVSSNGLNESSQAQIEKSFARSFQSLSPSGTWIESDGKWEQKP